LFQRQASLSTLQSKMAKQKRDVKKDVNSAVKKKSKKTDIDADNKVNVIKLQQMKSLDEHQKPTMNGDKKNKKKKEKEKEITKKPAPGMNDVKIQVSIMLIAPKLTTPLKFGMHAPRTVMTLVYTERVFENWAWSVSVT